MATRRPLTLDATSTPREAVDADTVLLPNASTPGFFDLGTGDTVTLGSNNDDIAFTSSFVYLSRAGATSSVVITGFEAKADGTLLYATNVSTNYQSFRLLNEDVGSVAANRFKLPASEVQMRTGEGLLFVYSAYSSRWVLVSRFATALPPSATAGLLVLADGDSGVETTADLGYTFATPLHTLAMGPGTWEVYAGATKYNAFRVVDGGADSLVQLNANDGTNLSSFLLTLTTGIDSATLEVASDGTFEYDGNTVWHSGNDGAGTGLDADLLDGQQASAFQAADAQLTSLAALSYAGNAGKVVAVNAGETDFELITVAGTGTVTSVDITAPAAGITASGGPITTAGSITLALANDLAAVEGLASTGIVRRTAADTWSAGTVVAVNEVTTALKTGAIMATFDGGGSAVAAGAVVHVRAYYNGTITGAYLRGDGQTGSAVVDVRKDAVTTLPPTTSICASAKPTISSAEYSDDTTLTGWTTSFSAGDEFLIVVESCSTFEKLHLQLTTVRT